VTKRPLRTTYRVVGQIKPEPQRWDPFWGLTPLGRFIASAITAIIGFGIYEAVIWVMNKLVS
jgi:hypothetical protein